MTTQATANTGETGSLSALVHEAAPRVLAAIKHASAATGVDFSYMLEKADVESGMNAKAKSTTSSATGLYQFVDSTWMSMVKKYGAKCGLGHLAACIDNNGHVANSATRQEILNLRKDPETSAMMAAEYTTENKATMQSQLGPNAQIGPTELYLAHFMGAGGATNFMKAYQDNPMQSAATVCGKAASANHSVFYDHSGKPRSLADVYDRFARKFGTDGGPCDGDASATVTASATTTEAGTGSGQTGGPENGVAAMLMAQSGLDVSSAGATDGSTAQAGGATAEAATTTAAAAATQAAYANSQSAVHWFTPRLSIARIENASALGTIQSAMSNAQSGASSDPAHLALVNGKRHGQHNLNGHGHVHDAYAEAAS